MTKLLAPPITAKGHVNGLVQDAEADVLPLGSIVEGENLVALPAGLQQTRGGSRIMQTLHDGSSNELTHVVLIQPFTPVGMMAIGWSDALNKHYAYRLTADCAFFTGAEAGSRKDLTAAPSSSWTNGSTPARAVAAELFEKFFIADANTDQTVRNEMLSFNSSATVLCPQFSFAGGAAASLTPYCLEEYNGVLFIAGYGDESDKDRPEMLRHSYLARSPDATSGGSEGFDADAYLLLGAKGQRVTALRKGRGMLLAAKNHEFYRITGFGRAYPGWQYQVDSVQNTLGLGISNPHALTFAEGFWYGVGMQGPLRTDGFLVESLTGPRQRGWRALNQIDTAHVTYHPERRVILFSVHPTEAATSRSATYPWVQWVWDLERSVWQTDWKFGADLFHASAVTSTTGTGPSAKPSSPVTSLETTTGYTASWTNGDATAQTEFWERVNDGGTWTLIATIAAGTATYARTGTDSHEFYKWRVRHRKNGVTSGYTTATTAKTLMVAPSLTIFLGSHGPSSNILYVTNTNMGTVDIVVQRGGVDFLTLTGKQAGTTNVSGTGLSGNLRARCEDATWIASPSAYSNTVSGS